MNECCGDGNFCDFPWCDCIGNAEFRRLHKLVKPDDPWQDCGRPWCNTCRHRRPVVADGVTGGGDADQA